MSAAQYNCEWTKYIPWVSTALLGAYVVYRVVKRHDCCDQQINQSVQKDEPKVATTVDIEELGDKTSFCRCWKSKKFPYCDGSHNAHNKCTGDNVGPLTIKKE